MPHLRTTISAAAAAAAILTAAPAPATAAERAAAPSGECEFAFNATPGSNTGTLTVLGHATTAPDVAAAIGLTCEAIVGGDTYSFQRAMPGSVVAVAGTEDVVFGPVTICSTVVVLWPDTSVDTYPRVCRTF